MTCRRSERWIPMELRKWASNDLLRKETFPCPGVRAANPPRSPRRKRAGHATIPFRSNARYSWWKRPRRIRRFPARKGRLRKVPRRMGGHSGRLCPLLSRRCHSNEKRQAKYFRVPPWLAEKDSFRQKRWFGCCQMKSAAREDALRENSTLRRPTPPHLSRE